MKCQRQAVLICDTIIHLSDKFQKTILRLGWLKLSLHVQCNHALLYMSIYLQHLFSFTKWVWCKLLTLQLIWIILFSLIEQKEGSWPAMAWCSRLLRWWMFIRVPPSRSRPRRTCTYWDSWSYMYVCSTQIGPLKP